MNPVENIINMFKSSLPLLFLMVMLLSQACSSNGKISSQQNNNAQAATVNNNIKVDTLVTGLQNPWGMAFLSNNKMLITERSGDIRIVENGRLLSDKVMGVPVVHSRGQGGLLDIVLHPDHSTNGWIYFSYSKPGNGGATTTLTRAKLQGNNLTSLQELFSVQPYVNSNVHFGSRIAFDRKGYVYLSTGERGTKSNAQDLTNHNGKVMRLHDDGRVPSDNPFVNTPNAKPEIWSYGHRNIQGMVYDANTGILWSHEHGPKGGDEVNIIEKGNNYGWPLVTHGIDYNGSIISNEKERAGITAPLYVWTPSIAPCGLALVTTDRYPGWKGSLLAGALAGQHIARLEINNRRVVKEERLIDDVARVRAVAEAPDGYIYVLTESPGMLLRFSNR
jgi:glucose/arabinose dehydrogenase